MQTKTRIKLIRVFYIIYNTWGERDYLVANKCTATCTSLAILPIP